MCQLSIGNANVLSSVIACYFPKQWPTPGKQTKNTWSYKCNLFFIYTVPPFLIYLLCIKTVLKALIYLVVIKTMPKCVCFYIKKKLLQFSVVSPSLNFMCMWKLCRMGNYSIHYRMSASLAPTHSLPVSPSWFWRQPKPS